MKAASVSIVHEDPAQAGSQVASELLAELGQQPDVVLVFVTSRHDPTEVLSALRRKLADTVRVAGCSSFAEINSEEGLAGSVTAMGIILEDVECELFKLDAVGESSFDAGEALAAQVKPFEPKLLMILPDGITCNASQFILGLQAVLGQGCPIVGGVAAEHLSFIRTTEFINDEVLVGGVVAIAFRGPLRIATASRAGFQPVGATRTCTKVRDNKLILELDGKPALQIYKDLLGPQLATSSNPGIEFPLAMVRAPTTDYMVSDERSYVVRVVRMLDEETGGLLCGGDVPEGAKIRMTRSSKDDLIKAAVMAVNDAKKEIPEPSLAFVFNCAGRKLNLGSQYTAEVSAAFEILGPSVPKVGFYTYGEICPVDTVPMYHDETFTVTLVGTE